MTTIYVLEILMDNRRWAYEFAEKPVRDSFSLHNIYRGKDRCGREQEIRVGHQQAVAIREERVIS